MKKFMDDNVKDSMARSVYYLKKKLGHSFTISHSKTKQGQWNVFIQTINTSKTYIKIAIISIKLVGIARPFQQNCFETKIIFIDNKYLYTIVNCVKSGNYLFYD